MSHVVADIHFTNGGRDGLDSQEAPLSCSCGWSGVVGEWQKHKPKVVDPRARHRQQEMTVVKAK